MYSPKKADMVEAPVNIQKQIDKWLGTLFSPVGTFGRRSSKQYNINTRLCKTMNTVREKVTIYSIMHTESSVNKGTLE